MTRKYDTYAHMLEHARLRAVEAASESVLDDDVRQIAMDAARECVQEALRELREINCFHQNYIVSNRIQDAINALERAESNLTTTAAIPSEPFRE